MTAHELSVFTSSRVSTTVFARMNGYSYKPDCTVPLEELRYVRLLHYGFDATPHVGELVVNQAIADAVLMIFKELYAIQYPIEKMHLIDDYKALDDASMADNNSSAFNFRVIDDGTGRLSNHASGMALDINPLYNPYIRIKNGQETVSPAQSLLYTDRTRPCPYYIQKNDVCTSLFLRYGFTWGGDWIDRKDYQHFEKKL
ncbi:MAG: M15 family metallopeptidase [Bilophila sp.]